ncbi:MAG: maleylpyruvate isomerase family mycothiol-dependent enzyme [Acidimicrobiales bacterium]
MMTTVTEVASIPPISRREARGLAAAENQRALEQLRSLAPADWSQPTECPGWDVRAMAAHVVGAMEGFSSYRQLVHLMRGAKKTAGPDGAFVDGMTAFQVEERAHLDVAALLERMESAAPRQARFRTKVPAPMRRSTMEESVGGVPEKWRMGYLLDVILTRDTWMHRVDIARATGREMALTAEHDGRLVADVVAEWARRHGQPFVLDLTGPAGGRFVAGEGGDELSLDAIEYCRILSGRSSGSGLLAQEVPF